MNTMKHEQDAQSNTQPMVFDVQSKETYSKKNEELVHREKIDKTPFEIVGNNDKGWFIAFGKYKVSQTYPDSLMTTFKENFGIEKQYTQMAGYIIDNEMWMIIANMLVLMKDLTTIDIYKQLVTENKIPEKLED